MAKMSKVSVEFGISQATGPNTWIKASAGLEIELENGDENNKEEIWKGAWDRVTDEVRDQLKAFMEQN